MEEIKANKDNLILDTEEEMAADGVENKDADNANANPNGDIHGENLSDKAKVLSPGMTVLKRFFRSKLSVIGLVTLILLFVFSFVGPLFSPWSANEGTVLDTNPSNIQMTDDSYFIEYTQNGQTYDALYEVTTQPTYNWLGNISWQHWMGTDENGYDVLTRLMYGG
jgi:peptide/nickel transport system permease protein